MDGSDIAEQVEARTGYPTQAWDTGDRPTIVVGLGGGKEAWAEAAGFWSVHLRISRGSIPIASEPTDVPESEEDATAVAAGIQAALTRLISNE